MTRLIVGSLPPRIQLPAGAAVEGLSILTPTSNVGFGKKFPARMVGGTAVATGMTATDRSSMTITPVRVRSPPETSEHRIVTAPAGTVAVPFRFVNVELAMVPIHPGLALVVLGVTKWISPTIPLVVSKNCTVKRISIPGPGPSGKFHSSYHWIFNVSPLVALPLRVTSEYHSPKKPSVS